MEYLIIEKRNPHAVHGIFDSIERAERHINEIIPVYVSNGFFMDKSLKQCDFVIRVKPC